MRVSRLKESLGPDETLSKSEMEKRPGTLTQYRKHMMGRWKDSRVFQSLIQEIGQTEAKKRRYITKNA